MVFEFSYPDCGLRSRSMAEFPTFDPELVFPLYFASIESQLRLRLALRRCSWIPQLQLSTYFDNRFQLPVLVSVIDREVELVFDLPNTKVYESIEVYLIFC